MGTVFDVDRRRYISTASSLHTTIGRHWSVLIVVPEEDFVGFVTRNNRQALAMSLVIVSLASLLAGLLVVQGLRAIATPNWYSSVSNSSRPRAGPSPHWRHRRHCSIPRTRIPLDSSRKSPLGQWACAA